MVNDIKYDPIRRCHIATIKHEIVIQSYVEDILKEAMGEKEFYRKISNLYHENLLRYEEYIIALGDAFKLKHEAIKKRSIEDQL